MYLSVSCLEPELFDLDIIFNLLDFCPNGSQFLASKNPGPLELPHVHPFSSRDFGGWLETLQFQLGFLFQRLHAWRSLTLARAAVFRGRTFGNPKGKMEGTLIQQGFWGAEQFVFC